MLKVFSRRLVFWEGEISTHGNNSDLPCMFHVIKRTRVLIISTIPSGFFIHMVQTLFELQHSILFDSIDFLL